MNISQDLVPTNLNEAISEIVNNLKPSDIKEIKKSKSDACDVHFGFGMFLRNNWCLWDKNSRLVKWFKNKYDIDHADDISGLILDCVWRDVKKMPRRDKKLAKSYVKYWKYIEKNKEKPMNFTIKEGILELE